MMIERDEGGPEPMLERVIFFSDAVFAIAITLLTIEIGVPHLGAKAGVQEHLVALSQRIPNFIGFLVSFAVIAAFWNGHHRAFGLARTYAPGVKGPNFQLLCAIAFMPFSTAYMSENFGAVVPTFLYCLLLLVTGLLNIRLIRVVTSPPYVSASASPQEVGTIRLRGWGVVLGATVGLGMSLVQPVLSQVMLGTIPLWIWLLQRRTQAAQARPSGD
jgi:uncharacterized membrane protein